ncbi:nuclear exosome regulator NRDE2 [Culicoides brevitarsis]|uniref:nuclear exosome regulator NRDE2 n=1 Tax=Culicoides brevitarsis TaxID=469753 RepID=UPI00307BA84E
MSLFPAYKEKDVLVEETMVASTSSWLQNFTFVQQQLDNQDVSIKKSFINDTEREKHVTLQNKDSIRKEGRNCIFFIDCKQQKMYHSVETLKQPGCPNYRVSDCYKFPIHSKRSKNFKRYYAAVKKMMKKEGELIKEHEDLEYYENYLKANPNDVSHWLKYIQSKENKKTSDIFQKEKSKLKVTEKALKHNPKSEQLLIKYLELLPKVYPTDEVLQLIQNLIKNEPNNFHHWKALIFHKQTSMSQCFVPEVLQEYKKCMRTLFSVVKNDEIFMKIFKNCALFLRQSGLYEKFFSIIQLVLNLNFISSRIFLQNSSQIDTNVEEYEEIILKSGLPLNEIWLRIEKLRSAYYFLPCVITDLQSDPQRVVLDEDICDLAFPLINQTQRFHLFILVLYLMKYPFNGCLFHNNTSIFSEEEYGNDNIENLLVTFLDVNREQTMDKVIFNIINDLQDPPTYINNNLSHNIYRDMLFNLLLIGATCFTEKQNMILFKLYIQLERMLAVLEKLSSNNCTLTNEFKKNTRYRIKMAIKKLNYQNNLQIYGDYAWLNYEIDGFCAAESIFMKIIQQNFLDSNEFNSLCISYVELLICESQKEKAICFLTGFVLGEIAFVKFVDAYQSTKKLLVQKKLEASLEEVLKNEDSCNAFDIEDYFIQNKDLVTIKSKIYYKFLVNSVQEVLIEVRVLLEFFSQNTLNHRFLREKIYEIATFLHNSEGRKNKLFLQLIAQGLVEFPQNIYFLRAIVSDLSKSWMDIKIPVIKNSTINSVIFLMIACKYRCAKFDESNDYDEAYKKRILNLMENSTNKFSKVRQNALVWRLYMKTLFDNNDPKTMSMCRRVLYEALDICPWHKSLYLDGAFFYPEELSHLLDLILEKQIRIHAIPEELEILRKD